MHDRTKDASFASSEEDEAEIGSGFAQMHSPIKLHGDSCVIPPLLRAHL